MDIEKEEREDKGVHRFWRWGTACIFDIQITDYDTDRNRGAPLEKILEKKNKEMKKKYQEKCWALSWDLPPIVYMIYEMAGRETRVAEKRMAKMLAEKW